MHLVQILLPLRDNDGAPFDPHCFEDVADALCERFGGVTAYNRAPADGRWETNGKTQHDAVLVIEVMLQDLDAAWWADFRRTLEDKFRQEQIVVRAHRIERL